MLEKLPLQIGDKVTVTDWGQLYSTYINAAKIMLLSNWKYNEFPQDSEGQEIYTIISEMHHEHSHNRIFAITKGSKDFIIAEEALKIVKRKKIQKSEPKIQRFDPETLYHF